MQAWAKDVLDGNRMIPKLWQSQMYDWLDWNAIAVHPDWKAWVNGVKGVADVAAAADELGGVACLKCSDINPEAGYLRPASFSSGRGVAEHGSGPKQSAGEARTQGIEPKDR